MTLTRLKRLCLDGGQYGYNWPATDYSSEGVRLLRTTDLKPEGLLPDSEGIFVPTPVPPEYLLEPDDLLLTRSGTVGRSFLVPSEAARQTFAGFLVRFRVNPQADPRFVNYALRSTPLQEQVQAEAISSTIQNFNAERYANLVLWAPPRDEQRRIADFLDEQVALIDRAISLRQRQLQLAVAGLQTRIDDVFDTGEPIVRASRVLRVLPGYAFPSSEFDEAEGLRLLRGVNVGVRKINWREMVSWRGSDATVASRFALSVGDIVLGMDRPWISEGLRIARLTEEDVPALLLQRVALLVPGPRLSARYMFWAYQAQRFRREVEGQLTGLSVPHLSGDQIQSFRFPVPDLPHQQYAADILDELEGHVRATARLLSRSIDLLQERKQALITAAVTGQFDVSTASIRSVA